MPSVARLSRSGLLPRASATGGGNGAAILTSLPYPAASVEDITAQTGDGTGFRKMGDRTAEYRVWQANCPNEKTAQIHQAWLLPDSDIAIYEQRPTEFNDAVVQCMQLLR